MTTPSLTLQALNDAPRDQALAMVDGLYEHSPWIAEQALASRPFRSLAQFKHAMATVVRAASREQQLALVRAHPELAGKAMRDNTLTAASTHEQNKAGLTQCTDDELARIARLNADYAARFGHPFILAVRGPRAEGLSKQEILATFARRLHNHPEVELQECLRNIHRIVELRLNDKFGITPALGNRVWDWHESLSRHSDPGFAENGQLTVTYLTDAHRACAAEIAARMRECGFDSVEIDAVGNVVGRYHAGTPGAPLLMTGSHYDTVRNGGKYDGRLGIFVPMGCVRELHRSGTRLPFGIEVIGFAEEEGQRYKATFLGSGALIGDFRTEWLAQRDADGITMQQAMEQAGLRVQDIAALKRDPRDYLGFVEVHIEQGPVLSEIDLPLAVVTSINGSVRYLVELIGTACHAGTTPMDRRSDAAAGAAEVILAVERRAAQDAESVATVGLLNVPAGSINVVPGRCQFSLDMRAPTDAQRDALERDILAALEAVCERRQLRCTMEETMRAAAAPCAPVWQARWERAVDALGVPVHRMTSGAGHDAMKLHEVMPQAMLFVRGQNAGISHNPLESTTSDDMDLAVRAFSNLLHETAADL
ncbi:2-oxo-4-hydroxy-4-carboxy-5-ureidoimidazoline decarboxylase [Comamonadaceae bacterium G21597-S1]|nr:2-oxo-4-hydroxy-4-carboxy-5-ureidoimidazoline decarboxylase [Comamonadaceae bacterium G21597-S1]